MSIPVIYIALSKDDEFIQPVLSSMSEEKLIEALHEYNGTDMNPPQGKLISDNEVVYDGEFQGNLIRTLIYETYNPYYDEMDRDIYEIWVLSID